MIHPDYPSWVPETFEEPTAPLTSLLENAVAKFPNRVAMDFIGQETTYQQLADEVTKAAAMLSLAGVGRGDVVGISLPNCPQHIAVAYATWSLGAIVAEHNPLAPASEILAQIENHGARVIVAWENTMARIADDLHGRTLIAVDLTAALPFRSRMLLKLPVKAAREQRAKMRAKVPDHVHSYEKLMAGAPASYDATPASINDPAIYLHTGGTTGEPKAVVLTHRNLMIQNDQIRQWLKDCKEGEETIGAVLPFFHAFGLALSLILSMGLAATINVMPQFDPDMLLAANRRHPMTFFGGVPPMYDRLLDKMSEKDDFSKLRFSVAGAMPLDPELAKRWEEATDSLLIEGYGMTEASPVISGSPVSEARRPSTLGLPFPWIEVKIVDPEDPDRELPDGEIGELIARGPNVFSGYLNRPEETEATLHKGEWLRTGDLAKWDDGFLVMADRRKEMIINGGFNIYPSQVESAVRSMPGVEDVAVVGVPDGNRGESVVAALVLEPGVTVTLDQVRRYTQDKLSHYAMPKSIAVFEDLPHSQIGKVMRRSVREQLESWELQAGEWKNRAQQRNTAELKEKVATAAEDLKGMVAETTEGLKAKAQEIKEKFESDKKDEDSSN